MVGISVGGGSVTLSTGIVVPVEADAPRDLLHRVATGTPCVLMTDGVVTIVPAHVLYVAIVADLIRDGAVQASEELPLAIAVPGWWPPSAVARVQDEFAQQGIAVDLVNDAEAAVAASRAAGHALVGTIAVVDLRAEQASVVIVRDCAERPTAMLSPTRVHEEGGAHLDAAVLRHVLASLTELGDEIDTDDPQVIVAAREALAQSRAVREELSIAVTETVLPELPGSGHRVRVMRGEIEEIARPWADAVIRILRSAADESAAPVDGVLLTGGLATMPLISQRVSADLALEVHVPDAVATLAATGALLIAERRRPAKARTGFVFWRQKRTRPLTTPPPAHSRRSRRAARDDAGGAELEDFLSSILEPPATMPAVTGPASRVEPIADAERLLATDER